MPDLQTNSPVPSSDDPLSKLHKMSTTAGLGSGDYVAVNVTAVVAVLFGAGSMLARSWNELLIIPLVGVILGVIALRQIRKSNGTQTGTGIALVGLLLSLGIGGWVVASQATAYFSTRADDREIAGLIDKLGQTIKDQKPEEGYKLFGASFPSRVSPERYAERMSVYHSAQAKSLWGDFVTLKWNGRTQIQLDERNGEMVANTVALGYFSKPEAEPHRLSMFFRKKQAGWVIENVDLFQEQQGPPGGGAGPGGGAPGGGGAPPAGPAGPPAP